MLTHSPCDWPEPEKSNAKTLIFKGNICSKISKQSNLLPLLPWQYIIHGIVLVFTGRKCEHLKTRLLSFRI